MSYVETVCQWLGQTVRDTLLRLHPKAKVPPSHLLELRGNLPNLLTLDVGAGDAQTVASKLSGAPGLSDFDSYNLRICLLRFGRENELLREVVGDFIRYLSNTNPPWAAYRAFMSNRLIALDKLPGVRPIEIGEIWRRLFEKVVISLAGADVQLACGTDQLCSGLKAGIEGGIHSAIKFWEENHAEDMTGFS